MWLSNSPWCLMWDAYCNVLTTRPVATKLATGMVGTFLGDMVAQGMQGLLANNKRDTASSSSSTAQQGFDLDLARTARLVGFSTIVGTPILFVWFGVLDQVCVCVQCMWKHCYKATAAPLFVVYNKLQRFFAQAGLTP